MIELTAGTMQIGSKSLRPFQHGVIQWCYAMIALFNYVKARFNVQWVMTTRVNQDHLENLFSQIRGLGATYDHPGPVETLNRIRLLMIGHSEATARFSIENAPVVFTADSESDGQMVTVGVTATLKNVEESVPDELFEPFEDPDNSENVDENNNSSSTDSANSSDCSELGLKYFAGYLAFKFRSDMRHLGSPTDQMDPAELPSWLKSLSRGGLICPTADFVLQIKQFEGHFKMLHGDEVSSDKNVVKRLTAMLCVAYPKVPKKLVEKYSFVRTMFRVRYMNSQIADAKREKSKIARNKRKVRHFTT